MKHPAVILAVGLMLPYIMASDPNNAVMKLCELDFLHKLVELCANSKPRLRRHYDLSQASGDNGDSEQVNLKNIRRIVDNNGNPGLGLDYGQEPIYTDDQQYEQMRGKSNDYDSEPVMGRRMPASLPKRFLRNELSGAQLTEKCCASGCTTNEILHYCRP